MKIFLDFDDLLFDTRAFFDGLQDIFEEFGIPGELFRKSYQEMKAEFPPEGWCYSPEMHIERLRQHSPFDVEGVRKKLEVFMADTEKFLFPDVKEFLAALKKSGQSIFILSFGDVHFQTAKISGTGILPYIERSIIADKDKAESLRGEIGDSGENSWFFDDRIHFIEGIKRVFPKIRTVCVQRKEGRYHDEPNEFCDYVVKDLKEAEEILRNL
ncbi:MAG: HAD family hydrolase [bacterium]|nr:HAD family hydrolase [bacterium]